MRWKLTEHAAEMMETDFAHAELTKLLRDLGKFNPNTEVGEHARLAFRGGNGFGSIWHGDFCVRPRFSARARKTTPGAGALPFPFRSSGSKVFADPKAYRVAFCRIAELPSAGRPDRRERGEFERVAEGGFALRQRAARPPPKSHSFSIGWVPGLQPGAPAGRTAPTSPGCTERHGHCERVTVKWFDRL